MATRFLCEIADRHTGQMLAGLFEKDLDIELPAQEDFFAYEDALYCARKQFLSEVERRIKYEPSFKQQLENKDWIINCIPA